MGSAKSKDRETMNSDAPSTMLRVPGEVLPLPISQLQMWTRAAWLEGIADQRAGVDLDLSGGRKASLLMDTAAWKKAWELAYRAGYSATDVYVDDRKLPDSVWEQILDALRDGVEQ